MEREKVWREYHKELETFIRSKVKDREVCNDILQEVYIRLHHYLDDLKAHSKIRSWLFTVARNLVMDHFRKQRSSALSPIKEVADEESVTANPFEKCLIPHLNKLPFKYKEAFTKVELEDYSQTDLARELKISYSGAKSRVQRAKQLLKSYFKECCNITSDKYGNLISNAEDHNCSTC
jgi:RNA polymerase sigma-70 factor, ECF subfamily